MKAVFITALLNLKYDKRRKAFLVYDLATLNILLGTSAVSGNLHVYNIKKENKAWVVPITLVKERMSTIKDRIEKYQAKLKIMQRIMKVIKKT